MFNYSTKTDLQNATGFDTSFFAKITNLANLKSDVDKLDIDKLKNVPSGFSSLKSKVDKLDVDLSKLSDVVKNDVVKKTEYDELIKKVKVIPTKGPTKDLINGYKILNGARYFSSGTLQNYLIFLSNKKYFKFFLLKHLKFLHGNL